MTESAIDVRDLHAWYGESHVLHGVSLSLQPGEVVALLGRNGAGKTTTLKSILGVLRKRRGEIRIGGRDASHCALHHIADYGIGFVPEERGIFASLTVAENLVLPPVKKPGGMSLEEIYALFPNLYERRHSPGTRLSGGEQQMLAIARILRTGVDIILLDEPTEGLAPVIVQRIGALIHTLKARGMTILLVEQNFHFARKVADRYYVMEHGRIADTFVSAELEGRHTQLTALLGLA
ncbi:ABC transporter ATP-binding protein [Bordetella genomosp. 12]|uniref:ABC transporter ATP-binding protein n=1 Tax=Bordetella genomosp. 12 TaxID=463035 RepID=A0A261VUC1_9BORD|nr:ABC transporter ATP-binding protein [Bordetella genomosp. 12]OZI77695.1 ABC transporter ATP-binding protein [Bordetella genomosp. 12]